MLKCLVDGNTRSVEREPITVAKWHALLHQPWAPVKHVLVEHDEHPIEGEAYNREPSGLDRLVVPLWMSQHIERNELNRIWWPDALALLQGRQQGRYNGAIEVLLGWQRLEHLARWLLNVARNAAGLHNALGHVQSALFERLDVVVGVHHRMEEVRTMEEDFVGHFEGDWFSAHHVSNVHAMGII